MSEIVPAQYLEAAHEITQSHDGSLALFGTDDAHEALERMHRLAVIVHDYIVELGLAHKLEGKDGKLTTKEYVEVGGWQGMGAMLDVFPQTEWVKPIVVGNVAGWEARIVLQRRGLQVGAGQALCMRSEWKWKGKEEFELHSMAQTRSTGKAFRLGFGFMIALAGYETTPYEEMLESLLSERARDPAQKKPKRVRTPRKHDDPEAADDGRNALIMPLIREFAEVAPPEDSIKLTDTDQRHAMYRKRWKHDRLSEFAPNEVEQLAAMLRLRIAEERSKAYGREHHADL